MEQRWCMVATGWSKSKKKDMENKEKCGNSRSTKGKKKWESGSSDCKNITCVNSTASKCSSNYVPEVNNVIKNLDKAIVSNELGSNSHVENKGFIVSNEFRGLDQVQTRYEQVIVNTENLISPKTEHLAQHLCRNLKIRKSLDHCLIRSSSARKIGKIRRRSKDIAQLSSISILNVLNEPISNVGVKELQEKALKCNHLKSNDVKSLQTHNRKKTDNVLNNMNVDASDEQWTSGTDLFINPNTENGNENLFSETQIKLVETPRSRKSYIDLNNSQMFPSNTLTREPSNFLKFISTATYTLTSEENSDRASLSRLRTQNAGTVRTKTKLFDQLGYKAKEPQFPRNFKNHFKKNEV